jgi:hypothetical protein
LLAIAIKMHRFTWAAVSVLIFSGTGALYCPARAGLGTDFSNTATIDTKPPVITVDGFPEYALYQGGETVTFHWLTSDDHPGALSEFFTATVMIDGQPQSSLSYYPDTADYTWEWIVPEMSSARVHVEVLARDAFGMARTDTSNNFSIMSSVTDVPVAPENFRFSDPAPNPFNPSTKLRFHLPEAGQVDLTVYDARGHRIRSLVRESRNEGSFAVTWDGRDDMGRTQSGGMYLFVLDFRGSAHSGRLTRKAVLIP